MQDPFIGTWKLNVEKSQFDPNHRPSAGTMVFSLEGEGLYLLQAQGTKENGEKVTERPARFHVDGQDHPVPDFPGLTAVSRRPDTHTIQCEVRREDGSAVGGGTYVVAPDGLSLTATNFGYDTQLRQFQQCTTWDRS
ncbi:MAG TPA: hypothetical protein VMH81_40365 [Bryobacteraceae bacterium]|nr:hypothetical protein [Bryobacteraceae bacterium]